MGMFQCAWGVPSVPTGFEDPGHSKRHAAIGQGHGDRVTWRQLVLAQGPQGQAAPATPPVPGPGWNELHGEAGPMVRGARSGERTVLG